MASEQGKYTQANTSENIETTLLIRGSWVRSPRGLPSKQREVAGLVTSLCSYWDPIWDPIPLF